MIGRLKALIKQLAQRFGYQVMARDPSQTAMWSLHQVRVPHGSLTMAVANPADAVQQFHNCGQIYEAEELALMQAAFGGGVFVDVGANIGNHTLYFATLPQTTQVISFEPNPAAHNLLFTNLTLNGLWDKVTVHRVGLSDTDGEAQLSTPLNNLGGTSLEYQPRSGQRITTTQTCQLRRGDDLLADLDVGFLKIDVEGHEIACLRGLEGVLTGPCPPVFIEVSDTQRPEVEAHLSARGYKTQTTYSRYPGVINLLMVVG